MKRVVLILLTVLTIVYLSVPAFAYTALDREDLFAPDFLNEAEDILLSPMSGDNINIILMCLCISGGGLVILVVLTIISKNKK